MPELEPEHQQLPREQKWAMLRRMMKDLCFSSSRDQRVILAEIEP
jgi:hypothetical protein